MGDSIHRSIVKSGPLATDDVHSTLSPSWDPTRPLLRVVRPPEAPLVYAKGLSSQNAAERTPRDF
eukprot:7327393-Alexandrium_andersonii.AAC.1